MDLEGHFEKLQLEIAFFEENKERIERQYGRAAYVAIYKKQIIDSDRDEIRLAERIERWYPSKPVLIRSVELSYHISDLLSSPEA